jgi:hypothetical protein
MIVVIPSRFERETYSLEGCRSIQLSYGTMLNSSELGIKLLTIESKPVNGNVNVNKPAINGKFTISFTGKDLCFVEVKDSTELLDGKTGVYSPTSVFFCLRLFFSGTKRPPVYLSYNSNKYSIRLASEVKGWGR